MKSLIEKPAILIIALIVGVAIIPACSSSRNTGGNNSNEPASGTQTGQTNAAENNQTSAKETPKPTPANQAGELPSFKKGEDYKTVVREKLLKAGWKPAQTDDGVMNCEGGGSFCEDFPELEAGPAAGQAKAVFRWQRNGKILLVYTVDDPPFYSEHEMEKSSPTGEKTRISGKYTYRYTEDYGGEISFVFNDKNQIDYEWAQEDVTWKGDGNWQWDEAKQTLTATVFTEPDVQTPAESENTPPRKEIFRFQKVGNTLKLTGAPSGMTAYQNKFFQKR